MNQTAHCRITSMTATIRDLQIRLNKALAMITERDQTISRLEEKVERLTQNMTLLQQLEASTELINRSPEAMRRAKK